MCMSKERFEWQTFLDDPKELTRNANMAIFLDTQTENPSFSDDIQAAFATIAEPTITQPVVDGKRSMLKRLVAFLKNSA